MTVKRAYLLTRARSFELQDIHEYYDEQQQLNMVLRSGRARPLVVEDGLIRTESKTFQAPGDDDPEFEAEGCY